MDSASGSVLVVVVVAAAAGDQQRPTSAAERGLALNAAERKEKKVSTSLGNSKTLKDTCLVNDDDHDEDDEDHLSSLFACC